ncbi:glycine-rich domain-containing protein [Actinomadura rubrisoli]|uniref:Uncharacterized protein n=1 Tax=Actinomadura rubrisoli TaxID=2530368 RepID=A0A4V2YX07_9ACTN|nr:hypothetical protein [Actinomadura rubrisoli]TDD87547.1 hypothetical protein E1298_15995 [Actinomadura rubrisoli]
MTITPEKTAEAVKDPRDLVSPETFSKLVRFMVTRHRVTVRYAERVMEQTLVYLKAVADNPAVRIVPDVAVDPGWHCLIEHTHEYAEFCERVAGRFIHHVPIMIEDISSGAAMARTVPALHATGYPVDMEFWSTGETCCPENPCV